MSKKMNPAAKREIRNLLFVLGSGIAFAGILGYAALLYYGPSGAYSLQNVLLTPASLSKSDYIEKNSRTQSKARLIFDRLEYRYLTAESKQWKKKNVEARTYESFYELIANEKSLTKPSDEIIIQFSREAPSSLSIFVRPQLKTDGQSTNKVFQEVQFTDNYYRVELRVQGTATEWAYFYHPGIAKKAYALFVNDSLNHPG